MRKIPDDNLAYPALINTQNSSGSGFFINSRKAIYLVTASHVLFNINIKKLFDGPILVTSYSKENADIEKNILELDVLNLFEKNYIKYDFIKDIALIKIGDIVEGSNNINFLTEILVKESAKGGIVGVAQENIKRYQDVLVANEVFIFGYPISLGVQNFPQIDYSKPLAKNGIIAGKNDSLKSIVLDCFVYPGNSGGPVLEMEQEGFNFNYRIAGIVIQFVPAVAQMTGPLSGNVSINSGYSIAASMDGVLDFLAEFE